MNLIDEAEQAAREGLRMAKVFRATFKPDMTGSNYNASRRCISPSRPRISDEQIIKETLPLYNEALRKTTETGVQHVVAYRKGHGAFGSVYDVGMLEVVDQREAEMRRPVTLSRDGRPAQMLLKQAVEEGFAQWNGELGSYEFTPAAGHALWLDELRLRLASAGSNE